MFAQSLQGRVGDKDALRNGWLKWSDELALGGQGWRGSTAGIHDGDGFVALVLFDSEAAARRNGEPREERVWWERFNKDLRGEAHAHDCIRVDILLDRGWAAAGFARAITGRVSDASGFCASGEAIVPNLRERTHVLGVVVAWHNEKDFTMVVYFSSLQDTLWNDDLSALEAWIAEADDVRYIDLQSPWLRAPERPQGSDDLDHLVRPEDKPAETSLEATAPSGADLIREPDPQTEAVEPLANLLNAALERLLQVCVDMLGAAVVSSDGLTLTSLVPSDVDDKRLAAVGVAALALGGKAAAELGKPAVEHVTIEGSNGYAVVMSAGPRAALVAVTSAGARIGLTLFEMHRVAAFVRSVYGEGSDDEDARDRTRREVPVSVPELARNDPLGSGEPPQLLREA